MIAGIGRNSPEKIYGIKKWGESANEMSVLRF